jgi:hypothetical protein
MLVRTTPIPEQEGSMIRSVKHLKAFTIEATDGPIGSLKDLYFDDERWAVRYAVIDTGKWLPGRRVLISPYSVRQLEWGEQRMLLSISREQVKGSPEIDTDKPVSRQHEAAYLQYYGYPHYWGHAGLWATFPQPMLPSAEHLAMGKAAAAAEQDTAAVTGDSHLRSIAEVTGYLIRASDGELGHVDDFLIDDLSWAVRYLVVDTSNWWFGKHVLAVPSWIDRIDWPSRMVDIRLTRQALKTAPPYDRAEHVSRQWEAAYHQHLQQPGYWRDEDDAAAIKRSQDHLQGPPS